MVASTRGNKAPPATKGRGRKKAIEDEDEEEDVEMLDDVEEDEPSIPPPKTTYIRPGTLKFISFVLYPTDNLLAQSKQKTSPTTAATSPVGAQTASTETSGSPARSSLYCIVVADKHVYKGTTNPT